ncbi:MAG: hypothetical protein JWN00_1261 [Actinomycetia bacterium]|nr:hypothetical protein [Actinomycetes bacterium]
MSHSAFIGITRKHLGHLIAELAAPWQARRQAELREHRGAERRRVEGAGRKPELVFTDQVLITLVVLRLQLPHAAMAHLYGVDRSTITRAIRRVRPLLAGRGYATPQGQRLRTLADVFAYAQAQGVRLRVDGSEIQVRRPKANRPGRRAFVSGKKKMNTIKFTKICDERGRTLWDGAVRPGRMHDQTALRTEGIDDLLGQFPDVAGEFDSGYRGLGNDHPEQVNVPPKKPAKDAAPEVVEAYEQARHAQSSIRICVEHAIADSKNWRPLQRWIGRRADLEETIVAIGSLVSDRAAAR